MPRIDHALNLAGKGFAIFPVYGITNGKCDCGDNRCKHPGKHPATERGFYDASNNLKQVEEWWRLNPNANIGVATGQASKILVFDLDSEKVYQEFKKLVSPEDLTTYKVKSGRGYHVYYRSPVYPNLGKWHLPDSQVKGDKGYVIGSGSLHQSGKIYADNNKFVRDIPEVLLKLLEEDQKPAKVTSEEWSSSIDDGTRNVELTRRIGSLCRQGIPPAEVYIMVAALNQAKGNPPLEDNELRAVIKSISERQAKKKKEENSSKSGRLEVLTTKEFITKYGMNEQSWDVEDWIPENSVGLVASPPSTFKTWLLLSLAVSVATGEPFLDKYNVLQTGPVIFIQQEDSFSVLARRLMQVMCPEGFVDIDEDSSTFSFPQYPNIYWHTNRELHVSDKDSLRRLEILIKEIRPKLIIIDPLYSAINMREFAVESAQEMLIFKQLRDKYNFSLLIAHHSGKGDDKEGDRLRDKMWGSQFLNAWVETGWHLRMKVPPEGGPGIIMVNRHFKSFENPANIYIKMNIFDQAFHPQVMDEKLFKESGVNFEEKEKKVTRSKSKLYLQNIERLTSEEVRVCNIIFDNRHISFEDISAIMDNKLPVEFIERIVDSLKKKRVLYNRKDGTYFFPEDHIAYDEEEIEEEELKKLKDMAKLAD